MDLEHNPCHTTKHDAQGQEVIGHHHSSEESSHQNDGTKTYTHTHHHHHHHHHHMDSSERVKNRILMTAKRRKIIEKYLFRFMCLLATIVVLTCLYVYFFNPQ
jgi:hypothetical protein